MSVPSYTYNDISEVQRASMNSPENSAPCWFLAQERLARDTAIRGAQGVFAPCSIAENVSMSAVLSNRGSIQQNPYRPLEPNEKVCVTGTENLASPWPNMSKNDCLINKEMRGFDNLQPIYFDQMALLYNPLPGSSFIQYQDEFTKRSM